MPVGNNEFSYGMDGHQKKHHQPIQYQELSIKTVEAHRASIMDKTNSGTVADLMRVVMNANRPPVKDSGSMR